jgi:hypothetical protein
MSEYYMAMHLNMITFVCLDKPKKYLMIRKKYGLVATAAAIPTSDFTMWSTKSFSKPENI